MCSTHPAEGGLGGWAQGPALCSQRGAAQVKGHCPRGPEVTPPHQAALSNSEIQKKNLLENQGSSLIPLHSRALHLAPKSPSSTAWTPAHWPQPASPSLPVWGCMSGESPPKVQSAAIGHRTQVGVGGQRRR